jgi:hypothetical protein
MAGRKRSKETLERELGASCKPPAFAFEEAGDMISVALERVRRESEIAQASAARITSMLRSITAEAKLGD